MPQRRLQQIPWNAGRVVGKKKGFRPEDVQRLIALLKQQKNHWDLAALTLGIDGAFRIGDLLRLRVTDIVEPDDSIRTDLGWRQQKTRGTVRIALTPFTRKVLQHFIAKYQLSPNDFLFAAHGSALSKEPVHASTMRKKIKAWAKALGLNPTDHSGHTLRRTKARFLFRENVNIAFISIYLGHKDIRSTRTYLDIEVEEVLEITRQYDIFQGQTLDL